VEDAEFLETAKKNLHAYAMRHIGRAFDHGFLDLLSKDSPDLPKKMSQLSKRMREMEVPVFQSALIYPYLGFLNYTFRRPLLNALIRCKLRKQCS